MIFGNTSKVPAWLTRRRSVPEFLNVPWSIRDLLVFVLAWFGLQIVFLVILGALGPVWPGAAAFLEAVERGDLVSLFALNLFDAAVGLGVIGFYLRRYGVGWRVLGWRRVSLGRTILWLVGILGLFIVAANVLLWLISVLNPGFNANQPQENEFLGATGQQNRALALVALVILPPIVEETIFRGFLFPALSKRAGLIWGAVISSALFALAHGQANIAVYTFPLGLLLCFMYVRLGSIVPGILLHMVNNYLAYLAVSGK